MNTNAKPRLLLAIAVLGVSMVWGVLLPRLAQVSVVEDRLKFLDQRGIDPSAMYYTELDAMDAILDRIEGRSFRRR